MGKDSVLACALTTRRGGGRVVDLLAPRDVVPGVQGVSWLLVGVFFCGAALARCHKEAACAKCRAAIFGRGSVKGCPEQLTQWQLPLPID